ncbi:hypothetical protein REPUB_Repub20aG0032200 [Reevesia pubescens]
MGQIYDPLAQWFQTHLSRIAILSDMFLSSWVTSWMCAKLGLIFNKFIELDGDKMNMIKEEFVEQDRVWAIGPLRPIKAGSNASNERGGPGSIPQDQKMEAVASALEESGVRFIWTVKDPTKGNHNVDDQNVVPSGFEERVAAGRGLVIKGWTPQSAILEHRAVGSYLTHCEWNSVLE